MADTQVEKWIDGAASGGGDGDSSSSPYTLSEALSWATTTYTDITASGSDIDIYFHTTGSLSNIALSGITTDSTHQIYFVDTGSGTTVTSTDSYTECIDADGLYIQASNINFVMSSSTQNTFTITCEGLISDCTVEIQSTTISNNGLYGPFVNVSAERCLVIYSNIPTATLTVYSADAAWTNVTFINENITFNNYQYSGGKVFTDSYFDVASFTCPTSTSMSVINCAFSCASITYDGDDTITDCIYSIANDTGTFTDPSNGDYTLVSGSDLIGAGTSGSDIGAYQYSSGAVNVYITLDLNSGVGISNSLSITTTSNISLTLDLNSGVGIANDLTIYTSKNISLAIDNAIGNGVSNELTIATSKNINLTIDNNIGNGISNDLIINTTKNISLTLDNNIGNGISNDVIIATSKNINLNLDSVVGIGISNSLTIYSTKNISLDLNNNIGTGILNDLIVDTTKNISLNLNSNSGLGTFQELIISTTSNVSINLSNNIGIGNSFPLTVYTGEQLILPVAIGVGKNDRLSIIIFNRDEDIIMYNAQPYSEIDKAKQGQSFLLALNFGSNLELNNIKNIKIHCKLPNYKTMVLDKNITLDYGNNIVYYRFSSSLMETLGDWVITMEYLNEDNYKEFSNKFDLEVIDIFKE